MASHLRHCPKHRDRNGNYFRQPCPRCPAPAVPVATTPTVVVAPDPTPALITPPKKRGRPPKFDKAMTAAERQRRKRENEKRSREDQERRDLIAALMKIFRRMQPRVKWDPKQSESAHDKIVQSLHRGQRQFFDDLQTVTYGDLQKLSDIWKETPDNRGRKHGERSGQSELGEIAKILDAMLHDASLFESGDQDPDLARGFMVRPEGCSPDTDEEYEGDEADNTEVTEANVRKQGYEERKAGNDPFTKKTSKKLELVARWMVKDGKCSVCGSTEGTEHILMMLRNTEKQQKYIQALRLNGADSLADELVKKHDSHLVVIKRLLREKKAFFADVARPISVSSNTTGRVNSITFLRPLPAQKE
jgi:hypothetical protein